MARSRILITAGPTRELIDPVRFLSNRSSGKMGYALAEAAIQAGHHVTLISGPVSLKPPRKVLFHGVETTAQMYQQVIREAQKANIIIMAAAVSDYQPVRTANQKIKKRKASFVLTLKKTPDILQKLGQCKKPTQLLVGFAAETHHLLSYAKTKLKLKNLDFIVANKVGIDGQGFESNNNQAALLGRGGYTHRFQKMTKYQLAKKLIHFFCAQKG